MGPAYGLILGTVAGGLLSKILRKKLKEIRQKLIIKTADKEELIRELQIRLDFVQK